MKYLVLLCDGMADYPLPEYGGRTPMEIADKPCMDALAGAGVVGLVKTVPDHLPAGSDVANLSVIGYDPDIYYTGRSPLEAVSIGIPLQSDDITFRCNLVTLSDMEPYREKTMVDYSADEITTEEAAELIHAVHEAFSNDEISFYPGISYRHIMVLHNAEMDFSFTPPHDISGRSIAEHLPKGKYSDHLCAMMEKSYAILKEHPINQSRISRLLRPANSIWLWGEGKSPVLTPFSQKFGMRGSVVSAVDLVKGIGKAAGMEVIEVAGATGNIHTNYEGKAEATLRAFENGSSFVYLHFEGPDECGHRGEIENKIKCIEYIDKKALSPIKKALDERGEPYAILILPDHATPLSLRTHTREAVPYLLYSSANKAGFSLCFSEKTAAASGVYTEKGHELTALLFQSEK